MAILFGQNSLEQIHNKLGYINVKRKTEIEHLGSMIFPKSLPLLSQLPSEKKVV